MTPLRLALLSLARRRITTVVAVLSIALPVATGGMLLRLHRLAASRFASVDRSFDAVVGAKADQLQILLGALNGEGDVPPHGFTSNLVTTIRERHVEGAAAPGPDRLPFLRHLIPLTVFARYAGYKVVGTDASFWQRPAPLASPVLLAGAAPRAAGDVALSTSAAAALNLRLGDSFTAAAWVSEDAGRNASLPPVALRVTGLFADDGTFWDATLVADVATARATLAELAPFHELHPVWRESVTHYMLVSCAPKGCAALRDLIDNATVAEMVDVAAAWRRLQDLTGTGAAFGLAVSSLILLLGGVAMTGVAATRFDAMLGQLAVLRALGYAPTTLALWLACEGLLVGSLGVCLGAGLDALLFPALRAASGVTLPPLARTQALLSGPAGLLASAPVWGIALVAATVAAIGPLLRLYRTDVHRVLRGA